MSDDTVRAALRSDAPLVVVEAPAGCGKTHQAAEYARELAFQSSTCRLLILTHTHAACSVFAERTKGAGARVEIRTLDGAITMIASAYYSGLGLPPDTSSWVRQEPSRRHAELALKVSTLLKRHPMIAASLAHRYPTVICDEHQDSSGDQHSIVITLLCQGAKVRILADPMQRIFKKPTLVGASPPLDWTQLIGQAQAHEQLDTAHRWATGCTELGRWTLAARDTLKNGGKLDLRSGLPKSVSVVFAENQAPKKFAYQLSARDRKPVDAFEKLQQSLLLLTRYNETAQSLRSFFNRRIRLWEGHTRLALEVLVTDLRNAGANPEVVADSLITFLGGVGKGFSRSAFGAALMQETRDRCTRSRRGKPAAIQQLARLLITEPDRRGVAKVLRSLWKYRGVDPNFADIEIDCWSEFWDAIRLGDFESADLGLSEITNRRTYSRPKPPSKAISTIHKAKGLECSAVILMPCDAATFPDTAEARCLLYVAISRAKDRILLVVPHQSPSPLLLV